MTKGDIGSGAGQGGGTGGSIRDAGGAFGKREAAQEEQYFRNLVSIRDVWGVDAAVGERERGRIG